VTTTVIPTTFDEASASIAAATSEAEVNEAFDNAVAALTPARRKDPSKTVMSSLEAVKAETLSALAPSAPAPAKAAPVSPAPAAEVEPPAKGWTRFPLVSAKHGANLAWAVDMPGIMSISSTTVDVEDKSAAKVVEAIVAAIPRAGSGSPREQLAHTVAVIRRAHPELPEPELRGNVQRLVTVLNALDFERASSPDEHPASYGWDLGLKSDGTFTFTLYAPDGTQEEVRASELAARLGLKATARPATPAEPKAPKAAKTTGVSKKAAAIQARTAEHTAAAAAAAPVA
jgi:hypothetical protein